MSAYLNTYQPEATVSAIVRSNYRTAEVFRHFGINYCCGGHYSLKEACAQKNIEVQEVAAQLGNVAQTISLPSSVRFDSWKLHFLMEYIVNIHHDYLKQTLPVLQTQILTFVEGHKKRFAGLGAIVPIFERLSTTVLTHILQEEESVFPYIRQVEHALLHQEAYGKLLVQTLRKPISAIIDNEHKQIGNLLEQLRAATGNYMFPSDACTNYQVIFHKLRELDNDLVQHHHLENNILFPKAISMEQELLLL